MPVARIRFAEIAGLYSYGIEKNRIAFGEQTLIVGPNNSGKSSIFKALDFFLKCLTEGKWIELKPWDRQDVHEMTVGFELNCDERRYAAELLSITGHLDYEIFELAPSEVVEWLAPKLEAVSLTIKWYDAPFQYPPDQIEYLLDLEGLGVTVCSRGYNNEASVCRQTKPNFHWTPDLMQFTSIIENELQTDSREKFDVSVPEDGARISKFPAPARLVRETQTGELKDRVKFIVEMVGYRIQRDKDSVFVMLGRMLKSRLAFVSEERNFIESKDLEKLPLKEDGSNLQNFLFWLKNGNLDDQTAYSAIQNNFKNVMGHQNLSFTVSLTDRVERSEEQVVDPPPAKVYPGTATVRFVETLGQRQKTTDFTAVGAGIRETLFLISMCLGRKDTMILMDEPATNLHPAQIRLLMEKILGSGNQISEASQIAIITHSATMASLRMLSSVDEIARVSRKEYSHIAQPTGEDEVWVRENLPTFHLLKPDILFARKIVLVEGASDKIFLEKILDYDTGDWMDVDDLAIIDVGGCKSFDRFKKFLEMYEIPFAILADRDADGLFGTDEAQRIKPESIPQSVDNNKIVLLEKNLEEFFKRLKPSLFNEIDDRYEKKPEMAYHFVTKLLESCTDTEPAARLIKCLKTWAKSDSGNAG